MLALWVIEAGVRSARQVQRIGRRSNDLKEEIKAKPRLS